MQIRYFALFSGLASLSGVLSQTTTETILPADITSDGNLQGEIIGTGADGTTYRIAATVSGVAATETLIEDATHLSEGAVATNGGVTVSVNQECNYDSQHDGSCTILIEEGSHGASAVASSVVSGSIAFAPVALTTAKSASTSSFSFIILPQALIAVSLSSIALIKYI